MPTAKKNAKLLLSSELSTTCYADSNATGVPADANEGKYQHRDRGANEWHEVMLLGRPHGRARAGKMSNRISGRIQTKASISKENMRSTSGMKSCFPADSMV